MHAHDRAGGRGPDLHEVAQLVDHPDAAPARLFYRRAGGQAYNSVDFVKDRGVTYPSVADAEGVRFLRQLLRK